MNIYPGTPLSAGFEKYGYRLAPRKTHPVYKTRYSQPLVRGVRPGPKARLVQVDTAKDRSAAKAFSFYAEATKTPGLSFTRVIVTGDGVNENLLQWLEQNMVLHGQLIIVFSSRKAFLHLGRAVADLLESRWIPAIHHDLYHLEKAPEMGSRIMVPARMHLRNNPHDGVRIRFMGTKRFLTEEIKGFRMVP